VPLSQCAGPALDAPPEERCGGRLGAPFLIAGAPKTLYDLGLYLTFRAVPIEGERAGEPATAG
jgi:hypothetical protein